MTLHSMFSVPIIHFEIANWKTNKQKILDVLPEFNQEHFDSNGDQYTDFFHQSEEHLPPYADTVIEILEPYLAEFTERRRIEFTDMWCQKSVLGMKHGVHNHGHSGWSAVLYVEFDPERHTATKFYSPFNNPWSGILQTFVPPVKEGDLVIFPATISHEAMPNESTTDRTIISFNIRGKVDKVKKTMWDGDPLVHVPA